MNTTRNSALQAICRNYLVRLRPIASKFGLGSFVDAKVVENRDGVCAATESEVELLARACDDERLSRREVPRLLGKSYRRSIADGDFDKIKRLRHVGIYSKVAALLLGSELKVLCDE